MYSSLADSIHADSLTRRNAKKQLPLIVKIDYKYTSGFKKRSSYLSSFYPCVRSPWAWYRTFAASPWSVLKRQEQKRLELKAKEEEEQRLKEKEWQRQIDDCKQDFLNGERIEANVFLEIARRDGFEIHIRTKGTFNKSVNGLTKSGTIYFRKCKGKRTPDFTGCQRAIADYLNFLASRQSWKWI